MTSTCSTRWGDDMRTDEFIANMELELHEESEVPNRYGYAHHGNDDPGSRPRRWQKAYDVVDEFIDSDMEIASVGIPMVPDHMPLPRNLAYRIANNICTYARKQGVVAKKRGDKVYLIKDKEN